MPIIRIILKSTPLIFTFSVAVPSGTDLNPKKGSSIFAVPKEQSMYGHSFDLSKLAMYPTEQDGNLVKTTSRAFFNTPEAQKMISAVTLISQKNSYPAKMKSAPKLVPNENPDLKPTYVYEFQSETKGKIDPIEYVLLHTAKVTDQQILKEETSNLAPEGLLIKLVTKDWKPIDSAPERIYSLKKMPNPDQFGFKLTLQSNLKDKSKHQPEEKIIDAKKCAVTTFSSFNVIKCQDSIAFLSYKDVLIEVGQWLDPTPRMTLNINKKNHLLVFLFGEFFAALENKNGKWVQSSEMLFYNEPRQ